MLIKYDGLVTTQDNLSQWIFQKLDAFFENGETTYDIEFDFSDKTFSNEISFVELFSTESKGYEWVRNSDYFSKITDVLCGIKVENEKTDKKPIYRLSFIFDKATFDSYPSFDELRCHKLSFSNTVFKKGVRFRHIYVDDMLFEPRELSADATFFHREKADIDAGILRGKEIGKIGKFKYRHQLEGDGTTFLIGMRFTWRAEFTDCVLDKVQFSFIDEGSMSKCFFANSMLEDAKFYNCNFPFKLNLLSVLDKDSFYKNKFVMPLLALGPVGVILYLSYGTSSIITIDNYFILFIVFVAFLIWAALLNITFMVLMYFLEYLISLLGFMDIKLNCHIATADDEKILSAPNIETAILNNSTVREVYRQLKINFEKHGDYQLAGDFYYSQRYCETIMFGKGIKQSSQWILFSIHHWINGFGERWFRAFVWFWITLLSFAFFAYTPNEDFISTKSTPEYFLNAHHKDDNKTSQIAFDRNKTTAKSDSLGNNHFMVIATTNYTDSNIEFIKDKNKSVVAKQIKDTNKTFYAFDNRFDFDYTSQLIPILKNEFEVKFAHSLSKMIAPFISEEKKWFQDRSERAYYLGFLETILLWIFFLAFVFAVKNRIRR